MRGAYRVVAIPLLALQAVVGWPLFIVVSLAPVRAQDEDLGTQPAGGRIGTFEYPAEVSPRKGSDEGLVKVGLSLKAEPSDAELMMVRVFEEPLIPVGGEPSPGENAALAGALRKFVSRSDKEDVSAIDRFLAKFPDSRWAVSLQTNLALQRRKAGYFTEALERLEAAWQAGKSATDISAQTTANRALGELVDLNARFGRFERMKELFDETESREIAGSAQAQIAAAGEGYWRMTEKPSIAFRCGPYAVNAVMYAGKKYLADPEVSREPSTQQGTSLLQLKNLGTRVGWNFVPAKRQAGAEWPVPMVIHWKVGHFAAVTRKEKNRYLVKDPTFGSEIWVTDKALDREATGFGLIPTENGSLPEGWTALADSEAAEVWGKGGSETTDPNASSNDNNKVPNCPKKPGMPFYNIFVLQATLQLWDNPVGYTPPVGPAIPFEVNYNHLEAGQPATFSYANFGASWECNWVSYLQVDAGGTATVHLRGGGGEVFNYSGYDALSNRFERSLYSGAQLIRRGESKYERETPDGTREVYSQPDGTGRIFLKEVIDPQGNKVVLNYDANLRLTSIVDAIGQATTITYKSNSSGNAGFYKVYRATDPFGRYAEFTYNAGLTRLEKIRDVIGMESSFVYGDDGFITRLTTPYGNTDFYQYVPVPIGDGIGRGLLVILPDGSREVLETYRGHTEKTFYWDRKAMAMAPGDRDQAEQTGWLHDLAGHVMMDVPKWTKKAKEAAVNYTYSGQSDPLNVGNFNRPIQVQRFLDGGASQITSFEYNDLGRVTKVVDPLGRTFEYLYAVNNLDLMEVRQTRGSNNDLLGKWTYDSRHNVLSAADASGRKTTFSYNSRGQVTSVTNARGEVMTATYDTNGYLTQIDGPLSGTNDRTEATYDSYGRVRTITLVEGAGAAFQWTGTLSYDALDRVTQVDFPDGSNEKNVYSRLDLVRSKDRLGRWTQNTYNALAQVTAQRDPAGRVLQFEWCRCGALQGLTDAMGRVTKWAYDVQGRLIRKTYPDNSQENYEYESSISRLKRITDPAGNVRNYSYNIDNTPSGVTYDPASGFADVPDVSISWDADYRRMTNVGDSLGSYGYAYNAYASDFYGTMVNGRGRVSAISNSVAADAGLSFEYDELGRLKKRQIHGTANESSWSYDAAGRVSSWTNPLGTFTPTYVNAAYGVGRPESIAYPNGQIVNYDWEDKTGDFRLKEIENLGAGGTALSKFGYVTDAVSRILQWKQQRGTDPTERYDLGYNPVDELTSAVLKTDSTGAILQQYYYGYDPAGNRTSEQIDHTVKSATFNTLNQLTASGAGGRTRFAGTLNEPGTVTVGGQTAWMTSGTKFQADVYLTSGTNTVAVVAKDASNNTRTNSYQVVIPSGGSTTVTYDGNGNQLSDGTTTYSWDASNRLVKATYGGGASTEYGYDVFGNRVQIVEKDSGGAVTGTKRFVFVGREEAEQRDGTNAVIKRYYAEGWRDVAGSASYYYTKDHLGSVREVTDGSGALAARYDYDPYGRVTKLSGSVDSDMLYTGHYYDVSSGLFLTAFRAYDANLARWLSRDPIGEEGGINLYGYVANNPINATDPLGLFSPTDEAAAREMLKDPPKFPLHGPKTEQAVKWLNETHPELGLDNFIILNHPLPGDTAGNAIIPSVILIDESKHDDVSDIVETLAHEPMHPLYQWYPWEPIFDEWLGGPFHEYISDKAHEIEREYEREQKRRNCP